MVDFSKLVKTGKHGFNDKQKDSAFWLYRAGCDVKFIAECLRQQNHFKGDWAQVHWMMWDVLRGIEPCPPIATQAAFDKLDWSLREEYILRTMASFKVPPSRVADLLGRGVDQCKRKLVEMRERDKWLHEYAIKRRVELTPPDDGGLVNPEKPKAKQSTFFEE